MKGVLSIFIFLLISFNLIAQDYSDFIVQLKPNESFSNLENLLKEKLSEKRLLSKHINIWLVKLSQSSADSKAALKSLSQLKEIKFLHENRKVKLRETHFNDPFHNNQWALNNIGQISSVIDADIDLPDVIQFGAKNKLLAVSLLETFPQGIINSSFYGFQEGYFSVNQLEPGRGYWINALEDGLLFESNNLLQKSIYQNDEIDFKIEISSSTDQGSTQLLTIGLDSSATDGLDQFLGEQELPPPPPSDIFFIRFNLPNSFISSYSDIRFGEPNDSFSYDYELKFQLGEKASQLFLEWNQPNGIIFTIQDMFGGSLINEVFMPGSNKFALANTNLYSLKLIVSYIDITSVELLNVPDQFSLSQNYPNPFNPSTIIEYSVPQNIKDKMSNVKLVVYDILGNEIAVLVNEQKSAGKYSVLLDISNLRSGFGDLSSGVYFYRIIVGDFTQVRKMLFIK